MLIATQVVQLVLVAPAQTVYLVLANFFITPQQRHVMLLVQQDNILTLLTTLAQSVIRLALHALMEVAQIASHALFLNIISRSQINVYPVVTQINLFLLIHQSVPAVIKHVSLVSVLLA